MDKKRNPYQCLVDNGKHKKYTTALFIDDKREKELEKILDEIIDECMDENISITLERLTAHARNINESVFLAYELGTKCKNCPIPKELLSIIGFRNK